MDMLAQDKPIIKFTVKQLQRLHTLLHYELMGIEEELKYAPYDREFIDLAVRRNKTRIMYDFVKRALANYDKFKQHNYDSLS